MANHSLVDIVVVLNREDQGNSVEDIAAVMRLKQVRVIEYFTIEKTAYLGRLKVTGATEVEDLSM